jgi:hypothetical protein
MEKVVQDIFGRPMIFGPLIVVTALIIIATGLLIYKLTEKRNGQPEMPTYIFIEGLGRVEKHGEEITHVGKLHRELRREEVRAGLRTQPEGIALRSDETAAEENQG